jgi:hypothetical protein
VEILTMFVDHPLMPARQVEGFEAAAVSLLRAERFLAECAGDEQREDAAWTLYKLASDQFVRANPTTHDQDIAWTWAQTFEPFVRDCFEVASR